MGSAMALAHMLTASNCVYGWAGGRVGAHCGAVGPPLYPEYGLGAKVDMISRSLAARLDLDCVNGQDRVFMAGGLASLLQNKTVPMRLVDAALTHLFRVQFRLGMFDSAAAQLAKGASWAGLGAEAVREAQLASEESSDGEPGWCEWSEAEVRHSTCMPLTAHA